MKIKPAAAITGVVLALLLAGVVIYKTMNAPHETIGDYKVIPPKGAGKGDRG